MKKPCFVLIFLAIALLPYYGFSQTSELQTYLDGQKTKYFTESHPKAKGVNISIEYPSQWQREEGERPNIVQKFIADSSDGLTRMCSIMVKDLPSLMKLLSPEDASEVMFEQKALKEMMPKNATFIQGDQTNYDGQPGAWMIYMIRAERAGVTVEMYTLQHMFLYSGKMIGIFCSFGGVGGSSEIMNREFTRHRPLFQLIGNSIIIHDKWTNEENDSIIKVLYGEYWWLTLIVSGILTWGIGLAPPILIRFVFLRSSISKGWAIGVVIFLWFVNLAIFTELGSESRTHAALFFVAWVSYVILRKKGKKKSVTKKETEGK